MISIPVSYSRGARFSFCPTDELLLLGLFVVLKVALDKCCVHTLK